MRLESIISEFVHKIGTTILSSRLVPASSYQSRAQNDTGPSAQGDSSKIRKNWFNVVDEEVPDDINNLLQGWQGAAKSLVIDISARTTSTLSTDPHAHTHYPPEDPFLLVERWIVSFHRAGVPQGATPSPRRGEESALYKNLIVNHRVLAALVRSLPSHRLLHDREVQLAYSVEEETSHARWRPQDRVSRFALAPTHCSLGTVTLSVEHSCPPELVPAPQPEQGVWMPQGTPTPAAASAAASPSSSGLPPSPSVRQRAGSGTGLRGRSGSTAYDEPGTASPSPSVRRMASWSLRGVRLSSGGGIAAQEPRAPLEPAGPVECPVPGPVQMADLPPQPEPPLVPAALPRSGSLPRVQSSPMAIPRFTQQRLGFEAPGPSSLPGPGPASQRPAPALGAPSSLRPPSGLGPEKDREASPGNQLAIINPGNSGTLQQQGSVGSGSFPLKSFQLPFALASHPLHQCSSSVDSDAMGMTPRTMSIVSRAAGPAPGPASFTSTRGFTAQPHAGPSDRPGAIFAPASPVVGRPVSAVALMRHPSFSSQASGARSGSDGAGFLPSTSPSISMLEGTFGSGKRTQGLGAFALPSPSSSRPPYDRKLIQSGASPGNEPSTPRQGVHSAGRGAAPGPAPLASSPGPFLREISASPHAQTDTRRCSLDDSEMLPFALDFPESAGTSPRPAAYSQSEGRPSAGVPLSRTRSGGPGPTALLDSPSDADDAAVESLMRLLADARPLSGRRGLPLTELTESLSMASSALQMQRGTVPQGARGGGSGPAALAPHAQPL